MQPSFFTGPFAPMCEKFVAQQRAVGKKYETAARQLRQFDNFAKDFHVVNYQITDNFLRLIAKNVQRKMTIHAGIGFI